MAQVKPPDSKRWADVAYRCCLGRPCLNVHIVTSRAGTGSGSRATGTRFVCGTRDYHGCPHPLPESDPDQVRAMKARGWKATGQDLAERERAFADAEDRMRRRLEQLK